MKTVMIVDDQEGIRMLLREVLQEDGLNVCEAANGEQALATAEQAEPDLLLLDMKIPGMDGLEVLEHLRSRSFHMPVIMMTAYEELNMRERAGELGVLNYFSKPFDIEEVRREVWQQLDAGTS
ncbi:two-component system response regulator (stage 0 sporulation protein F) [Salsuginibacillus halophilus]|uniref:Two-component system response regulator (Stage 0 sporulation protein F) n=1 Tax=Salsuginibacillus halophilus TaxID=517424 RepID=A0A2P8HHZ0_9BACI|nr:response regulator [Salsuginibacillus halophilus]PSL45821.1 two-component system response regulator (stage 0 sporulation protein F) [Salsuginibacillus halophilus]